MKILIVTQYFWPENFRINDLALGLCERGNKVDVLTGNPNYPKGEFFEGYGFTNVEKENWNSISIYRSPLIPRGKGSGLRLMINYLSFALFSTIRSFFIKGNYDLIFVYEPSPITVGIPAVILSKRLKIPIFFWVQDLWPESVSAAGQVRNKFIIKQLDLFTRWVYRNSNKVLIQSKAFREYLLNQKVPDEKIIYYPNSTEAFYKVVKPSQDIIDLFPKTEFKVLFAGNIGEAQDFDNIIEAARIVNNQTKNIHFYIVGDGRKKNYLKEKVMDLKLNDNFHLLGAFPTDKMPDFFACSDALLVTLKKNDIFSMTIPSKVQSYLACGRPVIAALDGEGASVIKESKAGFVAATGNPSALADSIIKMYSLSNEERKMLSENARNYFELNFEREKLIDRLIEIFNQNE